MSDSTYQHAAPAELRQAIRAGQFTGPTAGLARGFVQANLVVLPGSYADEFEAFCRNNPRPCPLLARTAPGNPRLSVGGTLRVPESAHGVCGPHSAASLADLRTDVPRYRVFRHGRAEEHESTDIRGLWRDDFVAFLIGCSFTFENGLVAAGLPVRHIDEGRNVPMYITGIACQPAGRFAGPLVVSMRPYPPEQLERVREITGRYPRMHGAPYHEGEPEVIGITDLARPDFGDAVTIHPGEVPVFWACGVTPQLALLAARPEIAITHSPGHMFITDWTDESFRS